jgi:hypothetical protein
MTIASICRRAVLIGLAAIYTTTFAQAQTPVNFDGVWRGVWSGTRPATFELEISKSATGTPTVKQTRWPGTDTSGEGVVQIFNGTIESDRLNYDILMPFRSQVMLKIKNETTLAGTFTHNTNLQQGNMTSMDLTRK